MANAAYRGRLYTDVCGDAVCGVATRDRVLRLLRPALQAFCDASWTFLDAVMKPSVESILAVARARAVSDDLPYFGAMTPSEAQALLGSSADAVLIDVRTRAEWDYVGRVPGSILIEWNSYPAGTRNPRFLEELRTAVSKPEAPLLFLCRSGQRSDSAARMAAQAGYSKAFNVLEGFEGPKDEAGHRGTLGGWRKAGLPWVQG